MSRGSAQAGPGGRAGAASEISVKQCGVNENKYLKCSKVGCFLANVVGSQRSDEVVD